MAPNPLIDGNAVQLTARLYSSDEETGVSGSYSFSIYSSFDDRWHQVTAFYNPSGEGAIFVEIFRDEMQGTYGAGVTQLFKAIDNGAVPALRLERKLENGETHAQVVGIGGIMHWDGNAKMYVVDLGNMYITKPYTVLHEIENIPSYAHYAEIGVRRPDPTEELYNGYRAAVDNADIFKNYSWDDWTAFFTHLRENPGTALISTGGGGSTTQDQQIALLEATVQEKDSTIQLKDTQISDKDAIIQLKETQITDKDAIIQLKDTQLSEKDTVIQLKDTIIAERDLDITDLQSDLTAKDTIIASKDSEIAAKEAIIVAQDTTISDKDTEITNLNTQIDSLQQPAVPLETLYTNVVNEVDAATLSLADSKYSLGNLTLDLKTTVVQTENGMELQMMDAYTAGKVQEGSVSTIKFDLGTKLTSESSGQKVVPNLVGMTETAVRNKLTESGLKLKAIYQATDTYPVGQAFKQLPDSGTDIEPLGVVTVIFAKKPNQLN